MRSRTAPVSKGTQMTKTRSGPGGVGSSMQQISDTVTRITGRAYVGEVNSRGKVVTAGGNCLGMMFDINPVLLNDRVAVVASTYEKYVYHAMKFTYVPQCSTSTQGSVALTFDRDPLMYGPNPRGVQFLSEVMSYEHAVLTPAWTGTSTAYTRDPQELKTWFMGGTDGTLTSRETSQGNLLVHLSNVLPDVGLGFIVMDYVLDLVAPNLLPNKQGVTSITTGPSQWLDFNGGQGGFGSTLFANTNPLVPVGGALLQRYCDFLVPSTWGSTNSALRNPGNVGEYIIGGTQGAAVTPYALPTFVDSKNQPITVKAGQKLYFCTHTLNEATGTDVITVTFHLTLSSARASSSMFVTQVAGPANATLMPDVLYGDDSQVAYVGGWLRLICPAANTIVNTA